MAIAPALTGALRWKENRRWRGDGDVCGYLPPSGWTTRADLADIHPITGRALPRAVWWLIKTKE